MDTSKMDKCARVYIDTNFFCRLIEHSVQFIDEISNHCDNIKTIFKQNDFTKLSHLDSNEPKIPLDGCNYDPRFSIANQFTDISEILDDQLVIVSKHLKEIIRVEEKGGRGNE